MVAVVTRADIGLATLAELANMSSAEVKASLDAAGMSLQAASTLLVVEDLVTAAIFVVFGLLVYARRRADWWSLFVSLWFVVFGVALVTTFGYALPYLWPSAIPSLYVGFVWVGFIYFVSVYPTGRFVPGWTRFVFLGFSVLAITSSFGTWFDWESPLAGIVIVSLSVVTLYGQWVRYSKVSTVAQREQSRWLLVAIVATGVYSLLTLLLFPYFSPREALGMEQIPFLLLSTALYYFTYVLFVVAVGIAILRYRLWDIDVVVNRALIYGPLSIILAVVFAVSVSLINSSTRQLFGAEATATAAVVSALIVATIFQPLRTRIENWINRRVYPETLNLARDFVELSPDIRQLLSVQDLAALVSKRVSKLLNSRVAAVYLSEKAGLRLADSSERNSAGRLKLTKKDHGDLEKGKVLSQEPFDLVVPLFIPRLREKELVGVMGVGLRKNGRGYSTDDRKALLELGGEIGTAIYAAQLRAKKKKI
jgi:hypothetical protein